MSEFGWSIETINDLTYDQLDLWMHVAQESMRSRGELYGAYAGKYVGQIVGRVLGG